MNNKVCVFFLSDLFNTNLTQWDSYESVKDKDGGDEYFVLSVTITNMPTGSSFNKLTRSNADVTTAGIQYGTIKSIECPAETSTLEETYKLVEFYDYDTILSRKLVDPSTVTIATTLDNTFCTLEEVKTPGES
jgi:hypothetical protein